MARTFDTLPVRQPYWLLLVCPIEGRGVCLLEAIPGLVGAK